MPLFSPSTTATSVPPVEVTGTSQSMSVNTRYIANNAGLVTEGYGGSTSGVLLQGYF